MTSSEVCDELDRLSYRVGGDLDGHGHGVYMYPDSFTFVSERILKRSNLQASYDHPNARDYHRCEPVKVTDRFKSIDANRVAFYGILEELVLF